MDLRDQLQSTLGSSATLERELGGGGMSRVFVATEAALGRKIVVKVLPPETVAQVSVERFKREIQVVASLQHPHIVPVLSAGETQGLPFYTMPFVKGESLRERLARSGELSVKDTVHVLHDVAAALAYAHAEGVVHRDIKPENIIVSGGVAVVTDFGVAKAVDIASTHGGGAASGLTSLGVALGTPAYMSPEQASADPHVDHRADIYSFGCLAYEMLCGASPFANRPPQQMLAAHVSEMPESLARRRPNVPVQLTALVMKCLEKRAADRPQSAEELLVALDAISTPSGGSEPTSARLPAVRTTRQWWVAAVVIVVGAVGATMFIWSSRTSGPTIVIGHSSQLTSDPGLEIHPAISPDGKLVAYSAGNSQRMRIFLRPVGGGRTIALSDDSAAVESNPRWSPDGSQLLFLTHDGVSLASALGGSVRAVVPGSPGAPVMTATWSSDGREIAYGRSDSLIVGSLDGRNPRFVASIFDIHSCSWSPGGRWIACVSGNSRSLRPGGWIGNLAPSEIVLAPAAGGPTVVLPGPTALNQSPVWSPDGKSLFLVSNRDGPRDIYEQAIASDGRPRGVPSRLTTGSNVQSISLSRDNSRLAYSVYTASANLWTLPMPAGAPVSTDAATPLTTGNQIIEAMSVSSDGRWLVYNSDLRGSSNIYRLAIGGGQPQQLTSESFGEYSPSLSPDGRAVAYHSFRTGTRDIEVKPLDGGPAEMVTSSPAQEHQAVFSRDGALTFWDFDAKKYGAYIVRRDAAGRWGKPVLRYPRGEFPHWSPDGKLLTLGTTDGRLWNVPADSGPARPVYVPSAGDPMPEMVTWDPDGRTIYFKSHDAQGRAMIWSIPAAGGRPRLLVRFTDLARPSNRPQFATDGKRFYFAVEDRQSDVWVAEVSRR